MYQHRTHLLLAGVALACVSMPGAAVAHPPPFYWMPDLSVHSRVGVELIPGNYDRGGESAILVPASVFAEFALTENVVLLGRVPFAYVDRVGLLDDEGAFALGNVGLGLQLAGSSGEPHQGRLLYGIGALVHAPTASDEGDQGAAAARVASFLVPDRGRYLTDATTVRVRAGLRYESEMVFLQGEVGVDHQIYQDVDDRDDLLLGVGLGLGLDDYWALLGELTALSNVLEDDAESELLPVLDVGLRYHNPDLMAGLRVYWPFHESYRDASAIGLGFDVALRF
ncbi:MAG TPA: hypothetical protein VNM90_14650 [Haliangium sp.]|nr:hypothetical protein [Haliangium sp.]